MTEEEKAIVRARFLEGKKKAAIARGEIVPEPVKVESKAITPEKPEADPKIKAATKKPSQIPMPRTGRKVVARSTSQL